MILILNENYTKQGDAPFDLDNFMNILYQEIEVLETELENHIKKIKKFIETFES